MIKPTIGRVVLYYKHGKTQLDAGEQPHPALVCHVWNERMVNLACFDSNGVNYSATSVTLIQEGDTPNETAPFATWMPYQMAQAKIAEATHSAAN